MFSANRLNRFGKGRSLLGIFGPGSGANVARWRVNGHRVSVIIWTEAEWERLTDRPRDAQYYPCGVWCALRSVEDGR
jgi:hypothetical protein